MASNPSPDLVLAPVTGPARTVREWLTTFHLLFVAIAADQARSKWIMPTAARILSDYDQADCRVAWLVGGDGEDARRILGRRASDMLTFVDPDFTAVKGFGLQALPAIVHLGIDGTVVNAVEGWDPLAWRALTVELSRVVGWTRPLIPSPGDPGAFSGAALPAR